MPDAVVVLVSSVVEVAQPQRGAIAGIPDADQRIGREAIIALLGDFRACAVGSGRSVL